MLIANELNLLKEIYKLKAYYIGIEDEGEIVFAKSEKEAKQQVWQLIKYNQQGG